MKTKHTQGKWSAIVTADRYTDVKVISDDGLNRTIQSITQMGVCGKTREEAQANAKLIASAPEMLKELNYELSFLIHWMEELNNQKFNTRNLVYVEMQERKIKIEQLIKQATE